MNTTESLDALRLQVQKLKRQSQELETLAIDIEQSMMALSNTITVDISSDTYTASHTGGIRTDDE